jgi:hypothetical protein
MSKSAINLGATDEQAGAEVSEFDKFLLRFTKLNSDFIYDATGGLVGIRLHEISDLPQFVREIDQAADKARQYLAAKFGPGWVYKGGNDG